MAEKWASSAGALDLHLDLEAGVSRAEAVAAAIRTAIADGRLPAGAEVPSTRTLAADLGVARGTVTAAYARLWEQGHLTMGQGAPTRVATGSAPQPRARRARVFAPGVPPEEVAFHTVPRWDLRPGRPCTSMFPRGDWAASTRAVLARAEPADFDYPDFRGHPALREALVRYLGRARGVTTDADRIVVFPGYGAGLGVLASVLAERGVRQVQFEDPSLAVFRAVVAERGLRLSGVRVDAQGLCVDEVSAPVVVTTPAHQFPLGMTLSPARRAALAARRDLLVIEDDYDGEFRFAAKPFGALQALAPDHVVYAGTASKALAPAVGLGWFALPPDLVGPVADMSRRQRVGAPGLSQLVLAELLDSGRYDRHVRRTRAVYRRRRAAVLGAMGSLGLAAGGGSTAGLHVVVPLPEQLAEADVLAAAADRGVGVGALSPLWFDPAGAAPGLVVGYATPAEHAFAPALAALIGALRASLPRPGVKGRSPQRSPVG